MSCFVALLGLAEHHRQFGELDRAWHYLHMANTEYIDTWNGPPQLLAFREASAAMLHLDGGRTEPAREALGQAFRYGLIARDMPIQARMAVGTARYADAVGDTELAIRLLGASEQLLGAADRSDAERVVLVESSPGVPTTSPATPPGKARRATRTRFSSRTRWAWRTTSSPTRWPGFTPCVRRPAAPAA